MNGLASRRGQTILPEYVVGFFLVIAALVAMSLYVQRTLQARVRDAKLYMVDRASSACAQVDALSGGQTNCLGAAGAVNGHINAEYEPYYTQVSSLVDRSQNQQKSVELGSTFRKLYNQSTQINGYSVQLPPVEAK